MTPKMSRKLSTLTASLHLYRTTTIRPEYYATVAPPPPEAALEERTMGLVRSTLTSMTLTFLTVRKSDTAMPSFK
jgi:hypothetical protein